MQPIDYSIDVQSPFQSALQGFQAGNTIANMQADRQKQELANQAAQSAIDRQKLVQSETAALFANPNPTAKDFVRVASMLPEKEAASMRANWDALNKDRQDKSLQFAGQTMAAFNSGAPEVGISLLKEKAAAERNSGNEAQAKAYDTWAQLAEQNPNAVMKSIGMMVAQVPGGDKVIESVTKIGAEKRAEDLATATLSEQQSKAQSAAVAAKFAESNAAQDLAKKGWDITKIQEDIKINKENSRIAALNAAISREGNQLKRQEMSLKLQEMKDKRDDVVRGKVAEAESARADMDNFTNTVDRFLSASVGKDGKPTSTIRAAAGPLDQLLPTMQSDVADLEALADTITSQAFMAQIPKMKGSGALSDAEGKKLQASLQNFSLKQSPERLIENMKEAQRLILKGRANLAKKYGIPDSVPDTPRAEPSASDIDALLKKYGG